MIHPCKIFRSNSTLPVVLVLMLSMVMPTICKAAALGDELILSQLGDPVEVEIAVLQWEDIDLDQLQISAGTPQVYESFGLDYLPALESLNFNVIGPTLAGEVRVLVSSREPMIEPYLQLLLVMRWPGGSLLREYVLLFDPPRPSSPAPAAVSSSVTTPPVPLPSGPVPEQVAVEPESLPATPNPDQQAETADEPLAKEAVIQETVVVQEVTVQTPVAETVNSESEVEEQEQPSAVTTNTAAFQQGNTYIVQSGDNLWDIATRHGPVGANANLYQILLSLYELNRGAFVNGNISLLKYGVTLQLPTVADVANINPVTAQSLFDQRWNEGSERVDMAERGVPLPPLSSIFEPVVPRPEINPTAGIQDNTAAPAAAGNNGGLAIATSDALVPAPGGAAAQTAISQPGLPISPGQTGIPTLALAPAANVAGVIAPANVAGPTAISVTSSNAYLDGVNASAQFMQDMLNAKQQQVELIEAQMSEMSIRMLEITRVTERLNSSLEEALAERNRQQDNYRRDTLLLGGLILVLSIALIAIVAMVLKLAAQIRVQHEFLQGSMKLQQPGTSKAGSGTEKIVQPKPGPDKAKAEKLQKVLASEQALAVSIIEEEDLEGEPHSYSDENSLIDVNVSREQVNVPLGDMDIEHPQAGELPGSSR